MALKLFAPPFTIFAPNSPPSSVVHTTTEIRFSRWNNANAEKFTRHEREQKEIEEEIRKVRRYESASKIADNYDKNTTINTEINNNRETFKSIGTPSTPSRPSIPGKSSKYSKNPNPNRKPNPNNSSITHPAFRRFSRVPTHVSKVPIDADKGIVVGENGVSYKIPNAPFEFQYSYTETPKVKPLALREPPFVPFGPNTMPRPWTGRAPLPGSKKKLPEFDSFKLPPPHKKGVKPVQAPGPFLAGTGPKYVKSREEILGEPLSNEEVKELVHGCLKSRRQLNMGRDGLTHNMLDNIHAHWKRRRVCKIKCKGVCTVDMDNVCQQLEDKTGGKIIYSRGGVLFLFRGRNYNYRSRPRYPLMLWKPVTPVYPRLIMHAPEGLTLEEATEMRKRGRKLSPICKLGKNGLYSDLPNHVREAFEVCELVRINCQGMNSSDYKKIGAKLKDLVPCVLVSFEREHILMWRGREWKSSLTKSEDEMKELKESESNAEIANQLNFESLNSEHEETPTLFALKSSNNDSNLDVIKGNVSLPDEAANFEGTEVIYNSLASEIQQPEATELSFSAMSVNEISDLSNNMCSDHHDLKPMSSESPDDKMETTLQTMKIFTRDIPSLGTTITNVKQKVVSDEISSLRDCAKSSSTCTEGVVQLLQQAVESGSAAILDDASLDADIVFDKTVSLSKIAPPGPVFRQRRIRKIVVKRSEKQESRSDCGEELKLEAIVSVSGKKIERKSFRNPRIKDIKDVYPDILPQGSLGVDELAKLLS